MIVDAVDGPIARLVQVKTVLPRFSGEDLDKIVDYLTYVAVPAFVTARSQIAPDSIRLILALAIMVVSLYHFSDRESKTEDGYFVGFPAIWNAVVLYCLVLALPRNGAAALICLCLALTFVPLRFLHPLRVRRMRPVTAAITALWAAAAVWTLWTGFPGDAVVKVIFAVTAAYMLALGLSAGLRTMGKR